MLDDNEVLSAVESLGYFLLDLVLERGVRVYGLLSTDCKVLTEYPDCNRVGLTLCGTCQVDSVTLCNS